MAKTNNQNTIKFRTFIAPLIDGEDKDEPEANDRTLSARSFDRYLKRSDLDGTRKIFWLDELLHGGFHVVGGLDRPLRLVITGPPGSGKSLLLQQICYERAVASLFEARQSERPCDLSFARSLLVSLESPARALLTNQRELRWREKTDDGTTIVGQDPVQQPLVLLHDPTSRVSNKVEGKGFAERGSIRALVDAVVGVHAAGQGQSSESRFGIVGVDGLNAIFRPENQIAVLQQVSEKLSGLHGPKILAMVYDAADPHGDSRANALTYFADVVIELSVATTPSAYGYEDRYLEISKARYQDAVKGKHLFKIVPCL